MIFIVVIIVDQTIDDIWENRSVSFSVPRTKKLESKLKKPQENSYKSTFCPQFFQVICGTVSMRSTTLFVNDFYFKRYHFLSRNLVNEWKQK